MSRKVEFNRISQLSRVFEKKKWDKRDDYENVFERFGNLIECLNYEQSQLILELTERYMWLSYNEYNTMLRKLLVDLYEAELTEKHTLFVFPIKKKGDEDKTKSGNAVMYMLQAIKPSLNQYDNININLLGDFEDISAENFQLEENSTIVLVDDYVGTGSTLNATLEELKKNSTIKTNFSVLSIVTQERTVESLKANGVSFYYGHSIKKGISNYYKDDELEYKKKLMTEIEDNIPKIKGYRFGYKESEALITLIRTPNNTFPFFWKDYQYKKSNHKAPFPRY